jgi:glycosyltransferase involved in cell wall biosynthesis
MEIHQLTQGFSHGDATSNMALRIRVLLRQMGHASEIYSLADHIGPQEGGRCLPHEAHRRRSSPAAVLLYHFGTSSPLSDYYAAAPDRKVLVFHNVTPPRYFRALFPDVAARQEKALGELARLSACTDICCGISRFNLASLGDLTFRKALHFPGWVDEELLAVPPAPSVLRQYRDGRRNVLFVGRVAPNKKIEDLIRVFRFLTAEEPWRGARLLVAGSSVGTELYRAYLVSLCREMGVEGVTFLGHLSQAELNACYRAADAFVCASEHEGFCIPLMEAACHGVPVFAFDVPGVRETLGGCGVLFGRRDFRRAAETIRRVLASPRLRDDIVSRQKARLEQFGERRLRERLEGLVAAIAEIGGPA